MSDVSQISVARGQTDNVALGALVLAMVLWSSSFIALKYAFTSFDPHFVIWGRMFTALLCFLLVIRKVWSGFRYQSGDWKYLLMMTAGEPCLYFLFEAAALQHTTAAQAGMITALLPLTVAVGAALFLAEQVSRQTYLGFSVAIVGTIWLSFAGSPTDQAPNPLLGNFYEFLAMVCATFYTLALKHLSSRYSSLFLTAFQAFSGTLFFLPFVMLGSAPLPTEWPLIPSLSILYLGTAITLGAYGLYNFGVSRIPASRATAYINLIPVFTLILSWMLLGERFSLAELAASALVLLGVLISQVKWPFRLARTVTS